MRKSPLSRKSPLTRKKPLRKVSKDKAKWKRRYDKQVADDGSWVRSGETGVVVRSRGMERHHPFGRHGHYLLIYVYIPQPLHQWIHDHAHDARSQGWLQAPHWGGEYDPESYRPWKEGTLINEHLLSQRNALES